MLLDMEQASDISGTSNRLGVEFLLTELSLAKNFLDIADSTRLAEQRRQSYSDAEKAYRTILHFLPRFQLSDQQKLEIEEKLARLKGRFASAGISI